MEIFMVAILLGLIPAAIARSKGRSFGLWWLYGFLIFIVALPHALLLRPNMQGLDEQAKSTGLRKCPSCAEFVRPDAVVCKHCGRDIPVSSLAAETSRQQETSDALSARSRAQNFENSTTLVQDRQKLAPTFGRR